LSRIKIRSSGREHYIDKIKICENLEHIMQSHFVIQGTKKNIGTNVLYTRNKILLEPPSCQGGHGAMPKAIGWGLPPNVQILGAALYSGFILEFSGAMH
jgi:hypothetical protein